MQACLVALAFMAGAAAGGMLLDTRSISRPREFSGDPGDWPSWVFGFRSYIGLLSPEMEEGMQQAERRAVAPEPGRYSEELRSLSRQLFHLLVIVCPKGRAVGVMMSAPRLDGFGAWWLMCGEYEPKLPGRHAAMLAALIHPQWNKEIAVWRVEFQEWERAIDRYEQQSGQKFAGTLRIAVVGKWAPPIVQEVLRQNVRAIADDYAMMKRIVDDYVLSSSAWRADGSLVVPRGPQHHQQQQQHGGPQPMDVDAFYGKSFGKGKGKYGKGKDKSKDKTGKHKDLWQNPWWSTPPPA